MGSIYETTGKHGKGNRPFMNEIVTIEQTQLQSLVLDYFNILAWKHVAGNSKDMRLVSARQVYCWLCCKYFKEINDSAIALQIKKDRTTVVRSIQRVNDLLSVKDELITNCIKKIESQILQPQVTA